MNTQLRHIFDESTCLSRRQVKDYVNEYMGREEVRAAEHHINCCPLCNVAVQGLSQCREGVAIAFSELNSDFLAEHFNLTNPQVHLNSIGPAITHPSAFRDQKKVQPLWRNTSIAAVMALLCGLWYFEHTKAGSPNLQQTANAESAPLQAVTTTKINNNASVASSTVSSAAKQHAPARSVLKSDKPRPGNSGEHKQKPEVLLLAGKHNNDKKIAENAPKENVVEATGNDEKLPPSPQPEAQDKFNAGLKMYDSKNYQGALNEFRKEMTSADESRRHEATIMSARCYQNLGNDKEAEKLLKIVKE